MNAATAVGQPGLNDVVWNRILICGPDADVHNRFKGEKLGKALSMLQTIRLANNKVEEPWVICDAYDDIQKATEKARKKAFEAARPTKKQAEMIAEVCCYYRAVTKDDQAYKSTDESTEF